MATMTVHMAQDLLCHGRFIQSVGNIWQSRDGCLLALSHLIKLFGAKPLSDIRERSHGFWVARGDGNNILVLVATLTMDGLKAVVGVEAFTHLEVNTIAAAVADLAAGSAVVGGVSAVPFLT